MSRIGRQGGRNTTPEDDSRTHEIRERQKRSLALRLEGHSFQAIADALGHGDKKKAHRDVTDALDAIPRENATQLLELTNARLEEVIRGHLTAASTGDADSAHVVISAVKEFAKLNGLNAPVKAEVSGSVRTPHDELLSRLATLAQAAGEGEGGPVPEPRGS